MNTNVTFLYIQWTANENVVDQIENEIMRVRPNDDMNHASVSFILGRIQEMVWNVQGTWSKWAAMEIDKTHDYGGKTPYQFYSSKLGFLQGQSLPTQSSMARNLLQFWLLCACFIFISFVPWSLIQIIPVYLVHGKNPSLNIL